MWYVCYCEPKKALPLVEELKAMGIKADCPSFLFRRRIPRRNAIEKIERPMIGGVFFCSVDDWPLPRGYASGVDLSRINCMPDHANGGAAAVVSDDELEPLWASSRERTEKLSKLRPGDKVEVSLGPFKGRVGVVVSDVRHAISVLLEEAEVEIKFSPFLLRRFGAR